MFGLSTRIALDIGLEKLLFDRLVREYKLQIFKSPSKLYLDKTRPNIWIADKLKEAFPKSLFIGIERDPFVTVASMMKHKGVLAWHRCWKDFPVPNRILRLTPGLVESYNDISRASQCALRWVAHHERMNELRSILGDSLKVISYEKLILELQQFLDLRHLIPIPIVKKESLVRWRKQLSNDEVSQISDIVGCLPHLSN